MAKHILVPIEDAPLAKKALEVALTDYPDATLTVLHVMDPIGSGFNIIEVMRPKIHDGAPPGSVSYEYWEAWHEAATEQAAELFDTARTLAEEYGVSLHTVLEFGQPRHEIVDYIEEHDVDRVVLGSHGRSGAERLLLGSVAEAVVRRSPVPVMVVR